MYANIVHYHDNSFDVAMGNLEDLILVFPAKNIDIYDHETVGRIEDKAHYNGTEDVYIISI